MDIGDGESLMKAVQDTGRREVYMDDEADEDHRMPFSVDDPPPR